MEIKDGGPAYPMATIGGYTQEGMSLRDYFAAHASEQDVDRNRGMETTRCRLSGDLIITFKLSYVQARYAYADAMLAAREAK